MPSLRASIAKINSRLNIRSAATLIAGSLLLSSLLGLYRDRLLNSMYLHTIPEGLDAYRAAFTVPDFMFYILVSGALSVTFIPVFNQRILTGNKKSAWQLSSSMINFLALITMVASILIVIFAPFLVDLIAPGLTESGRLLAISMMRVIAVNPFLFAIATVISSMQQAIGRFTFYALAPTLYNIGIIIGALYFTNGISLFGVQIFDGGIMGVALGVVLGAILQLVVSTIGLIGLGFDYDFKIYWKNKGFIQALRLLPARSVDQAMDYLVGFVETNLASRMAAGTLTRYQQVMSLHSMPVNLIGVAISTAAFPSMTEQLSEGNTTAYRKQLQQVIRVIVWLALPVAMITFFARGYVVSFVNNGGDQIMATLLGILVVAILFRTIYHIAARTFYANQDTKTPLLTSIVAIGLNIVLAVWFSMSLDMGVYGLALAQSIVAMAEVILLFIIIDRRLEGGLFDRAMVGALVRMASATGFMSIITYATVQLFQLQRDDMSLSQTVPKFIIITLVSGVAYLLICRAMKLSEAKSVIDQLNRLLFGIGAKGRR